MYVYVWYIHQYYIGLYSREETQRYWSPVQSDIFWNSKMLQKAKQFLISWLWFVALQGPLVYQSQLFCPRDVSAFSVLSSSSKVQRWRSSVVVLQAHLIVSHWHTLTIFTFHSMNFLPVSYFAQFCKVLQRHAKGDVNVTGQGIALGAKRIGLPTSEKQEENFTWSLKPCWES